jgi:hypothetical protein
MDLDRPAGRGELHGIVQQIPEDLLEAIGVAGHRDVREHLGDEADAFDIGGGPDGFQRSRQDRGQVHGLEVDPHPSGHELIEVEEVLDEALEGLGTAPTRGNGAGSGVGVEAALIEEVADDRVQRLAQF